MGASNLLCSLVGIASLAAVGVSTARADHLGHVKHVLLISVDGMHDPRALGFRWKQT